MLPPLCSSTVSPFSETSVTQVRTLGVTLDFPQLLTFHSQSVTRHCPLYLLRLPCICLHLSSSHLDATKFPRRIKRVSPPPLLPLPLGSLLWSLNLAKHLRGASPLKQLLCSAVPSVDRYVSLPRWQFFWVASVPFSVIPSAHHRAC